MGEPRRIAAAGDQRAASASALGTARIRGRGRRRRRASSRLEASLLVAEEEARRIARSGAGGQRRDQSARLATSGHVLQIVFAKSRTGRLKLRDHLVELRAEPLERLHRAAQPSMLRSPPASRPLRATRVGTARRARAGRLVGGAERPERGAGLTDGASRWLRRSRHWRDLLEIADHGRERPDLSPAAGWARRSGRSARKLRCVVKHGRAAGVATGSPPPPAAAPAARPPRAAEQLDEGLAGDEALDRELGVGVGLDRRARADRDGDLISSMF